MENLTIKNILQKDIERKINGVVKADSNEKETIITELNEYVVTEEIRERLTKFFDKYVDSINFPTEDMGVWISGFFGSGKSHFLKMIGHILENNTYDGKKVVDFFKNKSIINNNTAFPFKFNGVDELDYFDKLRKIWIDIKPILLEDNLFMHSEYIRKTNLNTIDSFDFALDFGQQA